MTDDRRIELRPTTPGDLAAISSLLGEFGLPTADVAPKLAGFAVAVLGEEIVGVVGIEPHGEAALLRSLAVQVRVRRQGLARRLVDHAVDAARATGARTLFLLTTDAQGYFARHGFEGVDRGAAPDAIRATSEFESLCPASAKCMRRSLSLRERWPERTFPDDLPAGRLPYFVERLRGTAARVDELVRGVPPDVLRRGVDGKWSAQTNVGHLVDLDELHLGRLDDLEAGAATLRVADLANRRTTEAGHDERPIAEILTALRSIRARYVARLETLPPQVVARRALHPRLKIAMSATDLAFFAAEHDDYHLLRVRELLGPA